MSDQDAYIPYGDRPEWNDVQPLPQQDARDGLVPIAYSREYSDAMDYFRAIAAAQEYSERVLDLTEHIIRRNPAHYTAWQYRMNTLLALHKDLGKELQLMNEFAEENLKSYQVWHHRLTLITQMEPELPDLMKEIDFIHDSLMPDPKNYHTWAYLNWLYSTFSNLPDARGGDRFSDMSWKAELEWCERMLNSNYRFIRSKTPEIHSTGIVTGKIQALSSDDENEGEVIGRGDGRNNSAWSWRWYLMISRKGAKPDTETELEYGLSQIRAIPHNASAWNYLRGIHKHFKIPLSQSLPAILKFSTIPAPSIISSIPRNSPQIVTSANPDSPLPVPFAIEWLADCTAEQAAATGSSDTYREAAGLYHELAERWDVMRKTYWRFRRSEVLRQIPVSQKMDSAATE